MWGVLINDIVVVWQRENKASAKEYLRKSLQGECRDGLHADRHDRTVATDAAGVKSIKGECCGCTCANIAEP